MAVSLSIIGDLLAQLLRIHNRVSLPGLGAFVTEYKPAAIIKNGKGLLPPTKTVVFRTSELWNDGFLEREFAAKSSISEEEAKKQIAQFVREVDALLREGKRVEFPDFGTMRITADGDYSFKKDDDINLLPDAFGLLELDVKPLSYEAPVMPPVPPAPITPVMPIIPATPVIPVTPTPPLTPITPVTPLYPPPPLMPDMPAEKPERKKRCVFCRIILLLVLLANIILIARSIFAFYEHEEELYRSLDTQNNTPPAVTTPVVKRETLKPVAVQTPEQTPPPDKPAAAVAPEKNKTTAKKAAPVQAGKARTSKSMNMYHIMVGAYADEKTAKTVMQRLQDSAGCSCILVNTGGQRPYKISSFRYATQKEADEILAVFKRTDPEYGSAWVERY
jgi:nucleoid DNA-binding protein